MKIDALSVSRWLALFALFALVACSTSTNEPRATGEPLAAAASATIDSSGLRTLVVSVRVANRSATDQPINWQDDCLGNGTTNVQLFRGAALVWDLAKSRPLDGCQVRAIQSVVAAQDTVGFEERVLLSDLMGDSIPAAAYSIVAAPILTSPASPSIGAPIAAGTLVVANPVVVPPGVVLDGRWSGAST